MLINRIYHYVLFISIISISYSAQSTLGLRFSDLGVYLLLFTSLFISFRKKDLNLLLIPFIFLFLVSVNDLYYFAIQTDYSYLRPGTESGSVKYDRLVLYMKYVIFFTLIIALTTLQNNKKYSVNIDLLKEKIKSALGILYVLMIIFLSYQYWLIQPDRLSFPFSSSNIMWPQRTDGHALGIAMAFLIAFIQLEYLKFFSKALGICIIAPGIIILLLTGSSGGVILLGIFYFSYFRFFTIIKFLSISLVLFLLIFTFIEYSLISSFIESEGISRAISLPRLIRENFLTDDINRFTIHHYTFNKLFINDRLLNGMGFLSMDYYYYDAFIPPLIFSSGIIGLFMFVYFLVLAYKKNIPINLEKRKAYKVFCLMFLLAIFISEYHLVTRTYLIMLACVYYFSYGSNPSNGHKSRNLNV